MNYENINKLINHLKKTDPKNFEMADWLHDYPYKKAATEVLVAMESKGGCGTSACIAGHAAILEAAETGGYLSNSSNSEDTDIEDTDIEDTAIKWLGLTYSQAMSLFYRTDGRLQPLDVIPVLEKLRDTGVVDWNVSPLYANNRYGGW